MMMMNGANFLHFLSLSTEGAEAAGPRRAQKEEKVTPIRALRSRESFRY